MALRTRLWNLTCGESLEGADPADREHDGQPVHRASTLSEHACLRSEGAGRRPRLLSGSAATLVAIALAGCATASERTGQSRDHPFESKLGVKEPDGKVKGRVLDPEGAPLANATVILRSDMLPEPAERTTDDLGIYVFDNLPPGNYTVQVLAGAARVSKVFTLPAGWSFRSNWTIDPSKESTKVLVVKPLNPDD